MFNWSSLGKTNRSKFGKWLDKQEIAQSELVEVTDLSKGTISKLCNNKSYRPKISTIKQVVRGLKRLGKNVNEDDFWSM